MCSLLSGVIAEVNCLKKVATKPQIIGCYPVEQSDTNHEQEHNTVSSDPSTENKADPNREKLVTASQLQIEFHRAFHDVSRRKQNVVVSGLPEMPTGSVDIDKEAVKEADNVAFAKFCEENLSVKQALARNECVHLGQSDGVRPRRLLVHLTSESSATTIISASKALRRSDDSYISKNVYFNPDLSPAELKLAYEKREKIRQRRRAAAAADARLSSSLNADANHFGARATVPEAASSSVACEVQNTGPPNPPTTTSEAPTNPGQLLFLQQ